MEYISSKMITEKEILSKILRDYVFIVQTVKLDTTYFKKRIAEGVKNSSINYKTNVKGKHTEWNFFNNDQKFISIMMQMIDHLEKLPVSLNSFVLQEAWGLIENFGEHTVKHSHEPNYLSGVLYLNDHPQKLYFPDINQAITPTPGKLVIFSSFLKHYTKRNTEHKEKYAISFNFRYTTVLE
tara:strand:- start:244 stop:789 length:546 start_codon:yes stop_codon:yes gene_type:complete